MRESEHIRRDRSPVRLALVALGLATCCAFPALAHASVPKLVFPIVGKAAYTDDFGDPRGAWTHQGNDLLAARKAPVVAVEAGKVKIWTTSATAGCMLYLYGRSGTTYLYIHLNNDAGNGNDNRGGCKAGVSYAPGLRDGDTVRAGELIAYVGDSGDADGGPTHLHFELHPGDGDAVSPFRWLKRADKPLFAVLKDGNGRELQRQATITLVGTVVKVADAPAGSEPGAGQPADGSPPAPGGNSGGATEHASETSPGTLAPPPPPPPARAARLAGAASRLTLRVTGVTVLGVGSFPVSRLVTVVVPAGTSVEGGKKALSPGARVIVTSAPVTLSLQTQLARPGVLAAAALALS